MELFRGMLVRLYMHNNDPSSFQWEEWDWRPLARLSTWLLLGGGWALSRGAFSSAAMERAAREIILGWLLSFGILTYVQILVATGVMRLALVLDDAAYALAERAVRKVLHPASFAETFLAAYALELVTVLLSARLAVALL